MIGVEADEERAVAAALADAGRLGPPVEQHAEAQRVAVGPVLVAHLLAVGAQPGHVLDVELGVVVTGEETFAAQDRIFVPQSSQLAREGQ